MSDVSRRWRPADVSRPSVDVDAATALIVRAEEVSFSVDELVTEGRVTVEAVRIIR